MKNILAALVSALAFVFSSKKSNSDLQAHIAEQDKTIADLHAQLDNQISIGAVTDAAAKQALEDSKAAQAAAEANLAQINSDITEANSKAAELAAAITADPSIPVSVDAATGAVTHDDAQPQPTVGQIIEAANAADPVPPPVQFAPVTEPSEQPQPTA